MSSTWWPAGSPPLAYGLGHSTYYSRLQELAVIHPEKEQEIEDMLVEQALPTTNRLMQLSVLLLEALRRQG